MIITNPMLLHVKSAEVFEFIKFISNDKLWAVNIFDPQNKIVTLNQNEVVDYKFVNKH